MSSNPFYRAVRKYFPGEDNAGLRRKIHAIGRSPLRGDNDPPLEIENLARTVALTPQGIAGLKACALAWHEAYLEGDDSF